MMFPKKGLRQDPATGRIMALPVDERFWAAVDKNGVIVRPELGHCWEWGASRTRRGYGWFVGFGEKKAHRASWVIHNGPIPSGLGVLHRCDNPPCVCPEHLFLGTEADNVEDALRKGRYDGINLGEKNGMRTHRGLSAGGRNGMAKLDDAQAIAMRRARREGATLRAISAEYGVGEATVRYITLGHGWAHLDAIEPPLTASERSANRKRAGILGAKRRQARAVTPEQ